MRVIVGMLLGLLVGIVASITLVLVFVLATGADGMGAFLPGLLTLACIVVGGIMGGRRGRARRVTAPPDQWGSSSGP